MALPIISMEPPIRFAAGCSAGDGTETDDNADESGIDKLFESYFKVCACGKLDQQYAYGEDQDVVDQLHDGGIKDSVGAVEGFDDRDPDEPGVAEQQNYMNTVRYCLVLGSLISLAIGKLIAKMIARISRQTTNM